MPSHQDRIKENYDVCFHKGSHNFFISNDSDIAPYINPDGTRTTIKTCWDCGERISFTRTQKEFEDEIALSLGTLKKFLERYAKG